MVKITYYVHSTTTDNATGKSTGWLGGQITEKGVQQAKDLQKNIAQENFDAVFSSDLKRAVDSATINFENTQHIVIQDKRLRECNYGDLNGADENLVVYAEHIKLAFPNGETLLDVEKRIAEFLNFIKNEYDGKHIAIVAHKAPQLAIDKITNNKSWEQALKDDWRHSHSWQPGWKYFLD